MTSRQRTVNLTAALLVLFAVGAWSVVQMIITHVPQATDRTWKS